MSAIIIDDPQLDAKQTIPRRYDWIDGLRAVCALTVVLQHFRGPSFGLGYYAVIVFMVISGFCLMIPVAKTDNLAGGYLGFMGRRARRILPPYYAALALCVAVDLWTGLLGGDMHKFVRDIEGHVLIVHDLNIPNWPMTIASICSPMWSIALEWHVYFMFPIYAWLFRKCGAVKSTAFILLGWYAVDQWNNYVPFGLTRVSFYWFFALGMLASFTVFSKSRESERLRSLRWGMITLAMLGVASYCIISKADSSMPDFFHDGAVALFACALMTWLALNETRLKSILSTPILAWVGSWSYSLYLVHYVFLAIQLHFFPHIPPPYFIPAALVLGYLFHLVFERPFMKRQKRVLSKSPPAELPGMASST